MAFSVAKVTRVQDLPVAMTTTTVARVARVAKDHTMALSWTSVVNLLNFMVAKVARVAKDMHITKMDSVARVAKEVLVLASVARVARVEMEADLVLSMATTVAKVVKVALV